MLILQNLAQPLRDDINEDIMSYSLCLHMSYQ